MRAKNLTVNVAVHVTNTIRVDKHARIRCWCGQSVEGDREIVEEAHRQHLLNHELPAGPLIWPPQRNTNSLVAVR